MVHWFVASFVSASLQVLLQKLSDHRFGVDNLDDKVRVLKRTLLKVQLVVNDLEKRRVSDHPWLDLLQQLEQIAYEANDLIDEFFIRGHKLEGENKINDLGNRLLLRMCAVPGKWTLSLNFIQTKLNNVLKEIEGLKSFAQSYTTIGRLQTTSLSDGPVFGRELHMKEFMDTWLSMVQTQLDTNVRVIPIVGMVGVGKTTFAQSFYSRELPEHFEPFTIKMWIYVSREFDVMRISRSIIEAAMGECSFHLSNLESLQNKLVEILRSERFLLILDDVWNETSDQWDLLLKPLKRGLRGSLIVITTGSHAAASLVNTSVQYHLPCLSDKDCWELVKEHAQANFDLDSVPKLKEIGERITTKCKGLPLAAKIIGKLLLSKTKVNGMTWNDVLDTNIWELPDFRNELLSALMWVCDSLPLHVRQCFAYLSLFPPSFDYERYKLVQMWMGEGFIVPGKEGNIIEDVGSDYFNQLLRNSFLLNEDEKYKMHNTVNRLAQSISAGKLLRLEKTEDLNCNVNTRYLSLASSLVVKKETFETLYKCKGLRTLLFLIETQASVKELPPDVFMHLGRLRVLDLSCTIVEDLPENICNLKHLRFLDVSNTLLKWLPESVRALCLLETLRIGNCQTLLYLPKGIGNLTNLRHLIFDRNSKLTSMPPGIRRITCLQTLSAFIVGRQSGQITELEDMNSIRGSLCIKQLEMVSNPEEAEAASLANKKYIDRLELHWASMIDPLLAENVLDKLVPIARDSLKESVLRELTLSGYSGRVFPGKMSSPQFSKLGKIILHNCQNCRMLPLLGQLSSLKYLKVDGMHELVKIGEMFSGGDFGFPSLEILEFRDMRKLKKWSGIRNNDMKQLRYLTISKCPQLTKLKSLHNLQGLEKLQFEECYQLKTLSKERLPNSVNYLIIRQCPVLNEHFKEDGGQDWIKIEHIANIEINSVRVRMQ